MTYVEWVERVFACAMARDDGGIGQLSSMDVAEELGFGRPTFEDFARQDNPRLEGTIDAVRDLESAGIEMRGNLAQLRITGAARDVRQVGLRRALWPDAFAPVLDARAEEVLAAIVARSEEQGDDYARLLEVPFGDVWADVVGRGDDEYHSAIASITLLGDLREKSLMRGRVAGGVNPAVWPSYLGVVRAKESDQLEWLERLPALVEEWETTSVEFKRRVDLGPADTKAEFVHDLLALATTKASGRRFLIIGFDNTSRLFAEDVDPRITQDRIEQILNAYTEPIPEVRYRTLAWEEGTVGVIELIRDAAKVPYRFKKAIGRYQSGDVFVRHGSQVEPPTPAELAALNDEARRRREEPS